MISRDSTNVCPPTPNKTNLCRRNNNSNPTTNNCSSKFYRPLQQLYKTVYSPIYGNNSLHINFACFRRPSERYKTTNMTYGSFHYNNWAFVQKNRLVNYDREHFVRRCDNNNKRQKMNLKKSYLISASNSNENRYWTQLTSDTCCPIDCLNF